MCGIAGKLYFNQEGVTAEEIRQMTSELAHRGPDDEGIFVDNNFGLGHRRLSIIDLSEKGHQPMSDAERRIWIVFNGEIYNFLELKKELEADGIKFKSGTDTEAIIYLYKKYGTSCLEYLRGMFAFAIYDLNKKELFIARDRLGKKPLKYYIDNERFIFASELKAILKDPRVVKKIDYEAIDEYLTYKYVPSPKTGFKNIFKLPPAHYMVVGESGKFELKKYWGLDFRKKLDLSEEEWEDKVVNALKESVKLRMAADVPLGAHLSGGIDSSLIAALMAGESKEKVKTFSIGFKENAYNELPYAKLVADRYSTEHHELMVEPKALEILPSLIYHYEEPYADASALPSWYLAEATKKHVTVALNGDGGDENFAGYERYTAMKLYHLLRLMPFKGAFKKAAYALYSASDRPVFKKAGRFFDRLKSTEFNTYLSLIEYFSLMDKDRLYTKEFNKLVENSAYEGFSRTYFKESEGLDWLDRLLYVGINTHLPEDLLAKVDIASMAHALEVRSPFLDHEFMELTAKMPSGLKMKIFDKKYLLKKIAGKYLPAECIDRPKQGFTVPLDYWFRGELNDYLKSNILDQKFIDYGFFNRSYIESLIDEHENKKDQSDKLWSLLCLRLWLRQWSE